MSSNLLQSNPFITIKKRERFIVLSSIALLDIFLLSIILFRQDFELLEVWLAFSCYLFSLALPFATYQKSWGWFHPIIISTLWFALHEIFPRIGTVLDGLNYHIAIPNGAHDSLNNVVVFSFLLMTLGQLSTYLGFLHCKRIKIRKVTFKKPKFLNIKLLLVMIPSLLAFVFLVQKAGGISPLLLQRGAAAEDRIKNLVGGQWFFFANLLKTACLMSLACRPDLFKKVPFWIVSIIAMIVGFAATGSRSGIIVFIIMSIAIWSLQNRKIPFFKFSIAALICIFLLGALFQFRVGTRGVSTLSDVEVNTGPLVGIMAGLEDFTHRKSENDGLHAVIGNVPGRVDHLLGESYLSILSAPIPRSIWPDKPRAAGRLNSIHIYGNDANGIPPGNIGEAYWNFSIPGVFLVMYLYGVFLRLVESVYKANSGEGWAICVYVFTIFLFEPNSPSFYDWLQAVIPLLFLLVLFCGLPRYVRYKTFKSGNLI